MIKSQKSPKDEQIISNKSYHNSKEIKEKVNQPILFGENNKNVKIKFDSKKKIELIHDNLGKKKNNEITSI